MILNTNYLDEFGDIRQLVYKVSHNITSDMQLAVFVEEVLKPINESLLVIRGISDFDYSPELTKKKLKSKKLSIKYKSGGYDHIVLQEPAYGSPMECVNRNIELMTQIKCQKLQSYFESIKFNLMPLDQKSDSIYLSLTEIKSNGIITNLYEVNFKFNGEWSSTCQSCVNGMLHLRNEFNKVSNQLYILPNENIEADGAIISDLNVNNTDLLKDQISILLSNALLEAKVDNFEIIDVKILE